MAWGGVGRCVAERDGNRAWRAMKRLDRSPAPTPSPSPPTSSYPYSFSVGSAQGLLLSQLLSEAAHPGLRAGSARLQFSQESERVFLPLGFLYPGLHFPRPAPRKPAFSLSGNKCILLVVVPAVTKAATGAQRARARTGLRRGAAAATGFRVQQALVSNPPHSAVSVGLGSDRLCCLGWGAKAPRAYGHGASYLGSQDPAR